MKHENKLLINGAVVKKIREKLGITQAKVTDTLLDGHRISQSTLARIEKTAAFEAKQIQLDILSEALRTPAEGLLCAPSDTRIASVLMQRILDGEQLYNLTRILHGAVWNIPNEPRNVKAREAVLDLCSKLDDMNGSYQYYPKPAESELMKLKEQFLLRDMLDRLQEENIQVYAGTHYRFEAIVSADINEELPDEKGNPTYSSGWCTCWAGVLEKEWIDALEKAGNTFMEDYHFRDLLAVTFLEGEGLDENIISTFEIDPTNLLTSEKRQSRQEPDFWENNVKRATIGEAPLTYAEFREKLLSSKNQSATGVAS